MWPLVSDKQHNREIDALFVDTDRLRSFVCLILDVVVGFIEVSVREEVAGDDHSGKVGFLEGWYVLPKYRQQGIGARLLKTAEEWVQNNGCNVLKSDSCVGNTLGWRVHTKMGFEETERVVNYEKALK